MEISNLFCYNNPSFKGIKQQMQTAEPPKSDEVISNLRLEVSTLEDALTEANNKIKWFEEQIKLGKQRAFGKKSETSSVLQLSLFDDNECDEVTETVEPIDAEKEQITYERNKRKPKNGRNIDTSKLPRERQIHDLSDADKTCACGCELKKIGEDVSEQLEYVPAVLKVIEHVRPKYTCRSCETIKTAAKPEQPIAKSMASVSLLTEVIIKKYDHHLPLYRQSKIFAQEGIDIPDNTLGNWVMGCAELLDPLGNELWNQLSQVNYLQADETPVKILKPDKKGYMWGYHSCEVDNRFIIFEFNLSRSADVVNQRLQHYTGILQTDGYSGYNKFRHKRDVINVGCWDHARRKFTDAIKISNDNKTGVAGQFLKLINKLYKIERTIKTASVERCYQVRQEQSKPILEELFTLANKINALPKSTLGKAITYLKNNQPYLLAYMNHGHVNISNCWIENQIRPFAIGKKNWLFVGNETSANKSALLYSLIQSCKINTINPRKYLNYVLTQVHAMRRNEIEPRSILPQFIDTKLL